MQEGINRGRGGGGVEPVETTGCPESYVGGLKERRKKEEKQKTTCVSEITPVDTPLEPTLSLRVRYNNSSTPDFRARKLQEYSFQLYMVLRYHGEVHNK